MRQIRILVILVTMLLTMMIFIPASPASDTNISFENRNDCIVLINESFENGFPPENWTNTGWQDSVYGEPYHGDHWAYCWTYGSELTMPPLEFEDKTTLTFWYRAEKSTHAMSSEVYVNDTLVWYDYGFTHDVYEMVTVNLDSFSGLKTITFFHETKRDFYGQLLDMITVTTKLIDVYVDDDFNSTTPGWQYDHFDKIQDGIDAVAENGTVYVYNGTYYENADINKDGINLIGEDKNNTIIDAGGMGDLIFIQSDNVTIGNFTLRNSGVDNKGVNTWYWPSYENNLDISNNIFYDIDDFAIYISQTTNSIMKNNLIYECGGGIRVRSQSNGNMIYNNTILNMSSGNAFQLDRSEFNLIANNQVSSSYIGVLMTAPGEFTNNNIIQNNKFINCTYGIYIQYANNNQFIGNLIENNDIAITIHNDCNGNEIFHNAFINNNEHASDVQNNLWYNITLEEGNYWDNYTGIDADGDGIGDIPYDVPGSNNQDLYPFMHPNGWLIDLDVNQSIHDRGFPIRHAADGDWGAAQNFIPNYDILSYTQIYIRKFGSPEFNLTVELREDGIDGLIVDTLTFTPAEVPSLWTWLELDFTDITITPGVDYFIKCPPAPSSVTTSFGYEWGYAFGNQYDDGAFWFTRDGGNLWRDLPTMYEFVFKTYGYN